MKIENFTKIIFIGKPDILLPFINEKIFDEKKEIKVKEIAKNTESVVLLRDLIVHNVECFIYGDSAVLNIVSNRDFSVFFEYLCKQEKINYLSYFRSENFVTGYSFSNVEKKPFSVYFPIPLFNLEGLDEYCFIDNFVNWELVGCQYSFKDFLENKEKPLFVVKERIHVETSSVPVFTKEELEW